jgi:hypothetical protein
MSDLSKPAKSTKVKKTVEELLGEGKLKTGKTFLAEAAKKAQEHECFKAAAQEEERMRTQKSQKRTEHTR